MSGILDTLGSVKKNGLGFKMDETMSGYHRFEPGCGPEGKLPMHFKVTWGPEHVTAWLNPRDEQFLSQDMEGTVTVGGLCTDAPCKGRLELRYFSDHTIRYAFDFDAGDVGYHFQGEKVNIQAWNLPVSHTTLYGVLTEKESGKLISRSVTFFSFMTAPSFLSSFRLVA